MTSTPETERAPVDAAHPIDPTSAHDLDLASICRSLNPRSVRAAERIILGTPTSRTVAADRRALFTDLSDDSVVAVLARFIGAVDLVRRLGGSRSRTDHPEDGLAHLVATLRLDDALAETLRAVRGLTHPSPPLTGLADRIDRLTATPDYTEMATRAREVWAHVAELRWDLDVDGARVTVSADVGRDDPDVASEVMSTFGDFLHQAGTMRTEPPTDLGYAEAQVLGLVADTFPETFAAVRTFGGNYPAALPDPIIAAVDELVFCLDYRAMLTRAGVASCAAEMDEGSATSIEVRGFVDLALACRGVEAVANDLTLDADETVVSVTGPNSSGKTTFARAVGQIMHLAAHGLPVAAASARIPSVDRVLTHFGCVDATLAEGSRLEGELHRLRTVLAAATERSMLLVNELFSSTTQADAERLTERTVRMVRERRARCVWIGFGTATPRDALEITACSTTSTPAFTFVRGNRGDIAVVAREIQESMGLTGDQIAGRVSA